MFASDPQQGAHPAPRTAIYLRSYPADTFEMECHRWALEELARRTGMPEPVTYLDNGRRPADGLPARDALLRAVRSGRVTTVLVPGLFVFSLDDAEALAVAQEVDRHSCRLVQLPSRSVREARPGSFDEFRMTA